MTCLCRFFFCGAILGHENHASESRTNDTLFVSICAVNTKRVCDPLVYLAFGTCPKEIKKVAFFFRIARYSRKTMVGIKNLVNAC